VGGTPENSRIARSAGGFARRGEIRMMTNSSSTTKLECMRLIGSGQAIRTGASTQICRLRCAIRTQDVSVGNRYLSVKLYDGLRSNAAGKFATTCVGVGLTSVNAVPPSATVGAVPKFAPTIVNCAGLGVKFAVAL